MQEFVHQHLVKEYIHPGMVAEVAVSDQGEIMGLIIRGTD
jgi:hypothetical protein